MRESHARYVRVDRSVKATKYRAEKKILANSYYFYMEHVFMRPEIKSNQFEKNLKVKFHFDVR